MRLIQSAAYDTESQARRAMLQFLADHPGAIAHTAPMVSMMRIHHIRATARRPAVPSHLVPDPNPRWRLDAFCALTKDISK